MPWENLARGIAAIYGLFNETGAHLPSPTLIDAGYRIIGDIVSADTHLPQALDLTFLQ